MTKFGSKVHERDEGRHAVDGAEARRGEEARRDLGLLRDVVDEGHVDQEGQPVAIASPQGAHARLVRVAESEAGRVDAEAVHTRGPRSYHRTRTSRLERLLRGLGRRERERRTCVPARAEVGVRAGGEQSVHDGGQRVFYRYAQRRDARRVRLV